MSHSHPHAEPGPGGGPTADVSVRVAWADDAAAIAAVQVRAWPEMYAGLLPADVLPTDVDEVALQWRQALVRPTDARHRALVALERNRVVGFALTSPAGDPDCDPVADGELGELTLDPAERAKGHGSRLLQAAVDTLAADRFTRAVTWVNVGDDALRTFLTEAGWAPDTAHRELDLDGTGTTTVKQVRLHTAIG
jgi:GNAT superfamily N-acetyltransferase